jgi:hypothetical protein
MTPQKKVVIIDVKYAGKPIQVAFIRHCQEVACMLGRFDIVNNYRITKSSLKRLTIVSEKYGIGLSITSTVSTMFHKPDEKE